MPDQKAIARRGFLDWGFQWRRAAKTKGRKSGGGRDRVPWDYVAKGSKVGKNIRN